VPARRKDNQIGIDLSRVYRPFDSSSVKPNGKLTSWIGLSNGLPAQTKFVKEICGAAFAVVSSQMELPIELYPENVRKISKLKLSVGL
jgi:hypothetical protein